MCFDKAVTGISKAASELEVGYVQGSSGATWPARWSLGKGWNGSL